MRIPRFHGPGAPGEVGRAYTLEGSEAEHLGRVLRLGPGAVVEVFDGAGRAVRATVERVQKHRAELRVVEVCDPERDPAVAVTAAVAPPRGKRVHHLVEALAELGVQTFVPLLATRCQTAPPPVDEATRWGIEAAKQCGRNRLLRVLPAARLAAVGGVAGAHDLALLADPRGARPLREVLAAPAPARVLLAVGPEGGFTDEERQSAAAAGFVAVSAGTTTLRIETAAVGIAAAVLFAWGG